MLLCTDSRTKLNEVYDLLDIPRFRALYLAKKIKEYLKVSPVIFPGGDRTNSRRPMNFDQKLTLARTAFKMLHEANFGDFWFGCDREALTAWARVREPPTSPRMTWPADSTL